MGENLKRVTIQDIAELSKTSKSSVSRYLNNGYVSEEASKRIELAIEQTGFQCNFFAKRLKSKYSHLIGVIIPRLDSVSIGKTLNGINEVLTNHEFQPLIVSSDLSIEKELKNIKSLSNQGVDGIIVQSLQITEKHIELINTLKIPVWFTGQKHEKVNCLTINDYQAGQILGKYIMPLNRKKIVFLGVSESDVAVGIERKKGFFDVFSESSSQVKLKFVETDFTFKTAYRYGEKVMAFKPDTIICATDNVAIGLMRYLHEHQIDVPTDIIVAGFGGYEISSVVYPPLTTVAFNYEELGKKVANCLLKSIGNESLNSSEYLGMDLIVRKSTELK